MHTQMNTENRENSGYDSLRIDLSSGTVAYDALGSAQTSSSPSGHPPLHSVYEDIDDAYLEPVNYSILPDNTGYQSLQKLSQGPPVVYDKLQRDT